MCEKKYIQQLEQYREDMIKDLQTLVRIKSVDELGINGDPVPFSARPCGSERLPGPIRSLFEAQHPQELPAGCRSIPAAFSYEAS